VKTQFWAVDCFSSVSLCFRRMTTDPSVRFCTDKLNTWFLTHLIILSVKQTTVGQCMILQIQKNTVCIVGLQASFSGRNLLTLQSCSSLFAW